MSRTLDLACSCGARFSLTNENANLIAYEVGWRLADHAATRRRGSPHYCPRCAKAWEQRARARTKRRREAIP